MPPFLDPIDPNIDPLIVAETNWLGTSMATALAAAGKKGIAIHATYDEWSPSRHYQAYHAGLRILTESASARLASPITIPFGVLETHARGYNAQEKSWNFADPWMGGDWHLGDIVDYQLIAYEGCLYGVAQNREMVLRNFYRVGKNAVEWKGSPFAFVIPPKQKDVPATIKLLDTLRFGMVEIYRAKDKFTADEIEYPAGSYVIPVAQPYGHYAKTLLERQRYPDLREYPGGPPKRPYDTTAQTLPLLMGVNTAQITAPFKANLEKLERVELPAGKAEPRRKQYLLRPDSNNAFIAVNRLLKAGAQVARSKRPIQDGGIEFPAGTFVIRSANVQEFTALGLNFYGTDLPLSDAVPLRQPRVALYKSHIPLSTKAGRAGFWSSTNFRTQVFGTSDIRAGNLNRNSTSS